MQAVIQNQINALKYLILVSPDCGQETKKACFALIDASEGLTKPVFFTGYSEDITYGVHGMCCSHGKTHLDALMHLMGMEFKFSHHGGYFISPGNFQSKLKRWKKYTHTIWLSPQTYERQATEIPLKKVKAVKLVDPLYGGFNFKE